MPTEPRSAVLQGRITASERARAEELAGAAGQTLSEWTRDAILAYMGQPTEGDRITALEREVAELRALLRGSARGSEGRK